MNRALLYVTIVTRWYVISYFLACTKYYKYLDLSNLFHKYNVGSEVVSSAV